ncbi:hypothetical protein GBA52_027857 [Prunus armeniaca]|nr:hypothetical protein GBA52_027857 [Prunus armeniaca]
MLWQKPTSLIFTPSETSATLCINSSNRRWAIHLGHLLLPTSTSLLSEKGTPNRRRRTTLIQIQVPIFTFTPIPTTTTWARSTTRTTLRRCTILTLAAILITWATARRVSRRVLARTQMVTCA